MMNQIFHRFNNRDFRLFVVLILFRLREMGRAGVVLSDGFMFGADGAEAAIKEKLLRECNLHTVIRLPSSVFAPYTSITTNLLFFDKTGPTRETWFYRLDMPEGVKHFSKTKPMRLEHFSPAVEWWGNRRVIEDERSDADAPVTFKARRYSFEELEAGNFSLDYCGYPHEVEKVLPPEELLEDFHRRREAANERIDRVLREFSEVLSKR